MRKHEIMKAADLIGSDEPGELRAALLSLINSDSVAVPCVEPNALAAAYRILEHYKQEKPYRDLDVALAADQVEFDHENARGTMVGLYCPSFMAGLNSIGWHFHFITEDLKQGGHVLQVSVDEAVAELDATSGFELMLPEDDAEFQTMDLSRNMDEAIHRAETATSEDAATATSEDTP